MPSDTFAAGIEAAARYMRHDGLCGIVGGYGYCTCGMEDAKATLLATPTDTDTAIPAGWKLVPIEPTEYMIWECDAFIYDDQSRLVWATMLAASPKPDTDTRVSDATKRMAAVMGCEFVPHVPDTDTPVDPGVEGVTRADQALARAIGCVPFENSHASYEWAVAEVIARHRLAAKPIAGMDAGEVEDA